MNPPKYFHKTLQGKNHAANEDKIIIIQNPQYHLFFVLDGVGGAERSLEAVTAAENYINRRHGEYFTGRHYLLQSLMYNLNAALLEKLPPGANTTYAALCFLMVRPEVVISSMGDTRIYGVTDDSVHQMTTDDNSPANKKLLLKCLGMTDLAREDFKTTQIESPPERYLICSDGFYTILETQRRRFEQITQYKKMGKIEKAFDDEVRGRNVDDASYIFIEHHV